MPGATAQSSELRAGDLPASLSGQLYVHVGFDAAWQVLKDVLFAPRHGGAAAVDAKAASTMLPWLILLGRGSIFWAGEMQAMLSGAPLGKLGAPGAAHQ